MDTNYEKAHVTAWTSNCLYHTLYELGGAIEYAKKSIAYGKNIVSAENVAKLERMQTELAEIDEEVNKVINSNE